MNLNEQQDCRGFLLTCQKNRQKQAVRDAFNFLTEFIDKIYPDLQPQQKIKKKIKAEQGIKKEDTLEQQLKQAQKKGNRVLYSIETNVKCLIFIKINNLYLIDPVLVVAEIMKQMNQQNRQLTRYCHKILPVQRAFKAQFFKMKDVIEELLQQKWSKQKMSWALNFKCRNNDKFKYKEILNQISQIAERFGHFSDIYYPNITISVEICHHLMCISICKGFKQNNEFKLKKINVDFNAKEAQKQQVQVHFKPQPQLPKKDPKKQEVVHNQCSTLHTQQIKLKEDDVDLL